MLASLSKHVEPKEPLVHMKRFAQSGIGYKS